MKKGSDLDNFPVQYPHFIDKEIDPEKLSEIPKVTQTHGSTLRT